MLNSTVELLRADMSRLLFFLFHQGMLDEQFLQLQQLQDESSPNFVSDVLTLYFQETERLLTNLREMLQMVDGDFVDYKKIGIHLYRLVGSSASVGARRVRYVCLAFRAISQQNNKPGCLRALEMLEHEYLHLKNKVRELLQMEHQRILASAIRHQNNNTT